MLATLINFIRSWYPPEEQKKLAAKRKRITSDNDFNHKAKRSALSPIHNFRDDLSPITSLQSPEFNSTSRSMSKRNSMKHFDDDLVFMDQIKGSTEKKYDAKKNGYEYITRFTATERAPKLSSPTLDYSSSFSDRKMYEKLLESSIASSNYATPNGSMNRSRRLVELGKSPKILGDIIDLTDNSKLSTRDRIVKVLDDFDGKPFVVDDSDSDDVEILPTPPSPKPDIKVEPVNSLKKIISTSKVSQKKWLEDRSEKHAQYLTNKAKEVELYSEQSAALHRINHDIIIKDLAKRVEQSLALKSSILPVEEEDEQLPLPELTDEHIRIIKRAFGGGRSEVLTKKFSLNLTRADIATLSGLQWLNDNVINFYMNLIIERAKDDKWPRAYAMNTFFYPKLIKEGPDSLKRWTRRIDLFSHEFICVPVHLGMHWCMAIINLSERTIKYYDSMGKSNNQCLNALRDYLEFEHMDKKKEPYSTDDFLLENVKDIPQQMNGSDCGMFACTFAEFATRRAKFTFSQVDMPYLRQKTVVEIILGEMLIQ